MSKKYKIYYYQNTPLNKESAFVFMTSSSQRLTLAPKVMLEKWKHPSHLNLNWMTKNNCIGRFDIASPVDQMFAIKHC